MLKCQVCGHNSDSPGQLQQHVRTHLEVRVPGERSPTPRQTTPSSVDSSQHHQLSPQAREPAGSSSPGANGSSATPRGCSPSDAHQADAHQAATQLRIKEEPPSDNEAEEKMEVSWNGEEAATPEARRNSSNFSHSPKNVKAEPTSPTPGSSPAHVGGAMLLPQYMFNPEAAILPQASEILAKMSEMVHSRIKQGQTLPATNPPPFFPPGPTLPTMPTTPTTATPPHKGATCFECDITFNNINNFYAHKRLYCSSRHHADGPVPAPALVRDATSTGPSASPQGGAGSRAASASPSGSDPAEPRKAEEGLADPADFAHVSGGKESSSEGEGPAGGGACGGAVAERASDGSQSPTSEDPDDSDPNKTFCEACNIRFTHHENYTVHKRFYCASRHDPSNHRSPHAAKTAAALTAGAGSAFLPQPIRTRKRKKMYEIHMARTEALAAAAAAVAAAVKQELSPSGGSSPEGDGPIDLSKRPRLREATTTAAALPALPLSDYHKCTACSISFNSIENYLAHKTYYCPATSLQPHTLEQLHRLHTSTSPQGRPPAGPDRLQQQQPPLEATSSTSSSPSPLSSSLPPPSTTSSPQATTRGATCPYCPSRLPAAELMEHLRSAHGLLVNTVGIGSAGGASEPRVNGQVRSGATSPAASPPTNGGSWSEDGPAAPSPRSTSPTRAAPSLTVSPSSEAPKEAPRHLPSKTAVFNLQPVAANPAPKTAALPSTVVHNGNSRFCRLCNIKFSSLSTFIAHKKYYCSSHSAEHVK